MTATKHRKPRRVRKTEDREVMVPHPTVKRFYGYGIPGVDLASLTGKLIVMEGADGSGRSTQIARFEPVAPRPTAALEHRATQGR